MAIAEKSEIEQTAGQEEGISLATLIAHLGPDAGIEFFNRIDKEQRRGTTIVGSTVRGSRSGFTRAHTTGQAQFVTPGRASGLRESSELLSDSVVIMNMDDFEAVVRAAQKPFDWRQEFAPRAGLAAATTTPALKRGSRGRRQLRA